MLDAIGVPESNRMWPNATDKQLFDALPRGLQSRRRTCCSKRSKTSKSRSGSPVSGAALSAIVRPLAPDDLAAYRALHRFALAQAPESFAETSEQDRARRCRHAAILARGEAWGAFLDGRLVGKLTIDAPPYAAFGHTRWLHAVYLHPGARGAGAADALVTGALASAKDAGAIIAVFG